MPYTDLLRVTVLLTGAEATALATITAIAANRDSDTRTLIVAAVWWLLSLVDRLLHRPPLTRGRGPPRHPGAGEDGHLAAGGDPRSDLVRPPLADRRDRDRGRSPRRLLPRRGGDRRRLRPARLARLALPRGRRARRSSSATASSSTSSPTPPCGRSSWSARPACAPAALKPRRPGRYLPALRPSAFT